ncbi:hypothetical protein IQ07DRAFT_525665, partial [Pyrenochaeta sp. DS3sAY3a]
RLREKDKFSDLLLTHPSGSFRVHRIVVCPQSGFFYNACTSDFKLENLVEFFYSMDHDEVMPEGTNVSPLQLHAQMFALADRYDISELLSVAAKKYCERCTNSWEPIEFLDSIEDVYELTPASMDSLRKAACVTIRRHLPGILDDSVTAERYEKALSENPDFAKDLLHSYIDKPLFGHCGTCHSEQSMEPLQTRCQRCKKGQSGLRSHWHTI